jgi:membrane-bound inhibitor of C-type lysozyme
MRASLLAVVVFALVSGCSPDEPDVVAVVPEPSAPAPEFEPGARVDQLNPIREGPAEPAFGPGEPAFGPSNVSTQGVLNGIRERTPSAVVPQIPRRLVFECTDGVMFAVRMRDNGLELYPPATPAAGFLALTQVPTASGVHYRAGDVDFRSKDDLATLEMGRERYVDCVANPAAATWQDPLTLNSEQEQRLRALEQPRQQ